MIIMKARHWIKIYPMLDVLLKNLPMPQFLITFRFFKLFNSRKGTFESKQNSEYKQEYTISFIHYYIVHAHWHGRIQKI